MTVTRPINLNVLLTETNLLIIITNAVQCFQACSITGIFDIMIRPSKRLIHGIAYFESKNIFSFLLFPKAGNLYGQVLIS